MGEGAVSEQTAQAPCGRCGMPRLPHQIARERGEVNHEWTAEPPPSPVERLKDKVAAEVEEHLTAEATRPRVFITVIPTPDLVLRRFLVEKGILTEGDLREMMGREVAPQLPPDIL